MDGVKTRAKTRALKKFEAPSIVRAAAEGDPPLGLYYPFGPMIAHAVMPQALVERINRYADRVVGAQISTEFPVPKDIAFDGGDRSLMNETENLIRRYLPLVDEVAHGRIRIDIFWIVSQYAGTPSPVHFHSGDISGVFYLKVPQIDREDEEEQKTYISNRKAGYINFLVGGRQRFSKSLVSFKPRVGDFYIFPGWLLHGAEPFRGTGERRSLAFNAYVEEVEG
ncbi:MAG TPA: putative 2OG-Fe(II) oxygenase [Xanthobacteraceae bacterium]|jgi:hypothetical protein|nr:putative 2OG-Fe(II) oxygenase [Xanthobacteraceae bacterium]